MNQHTSISTQQLTLDQVLEQASAHRESGNYQQAIAWLNALLAQHPEHVPALALLAHVQLLAGQSGQAAQTLATARQLDADHPAVQRNLSRLALQQQQLTAALEHAKNAYQQQPELAEHQLVLAAVLQASGQLHPARALIDQAMQTQPDYAEAWASRALLNLRAKDSSAALADIEQALKRKPHMASWWQLAAQAAASAGRWSVAIQALRQKLKLQPQDLHAQAMLGEFLRQSGDRAQALLVLEAACKALQQYDGTHPTSYALWLNYGTALQEDGQIDAARQTYEQALKLRPDSAEVASNLGAIAKDEENWPLALQYFEQALSAQPEHPVFQANRAAALLALDKAEEAANAAQQLLQQQADHFDALCLLARCQGKLKQPEQAWQSLERAKALANTNTELQRRWHETVAELHASQQDWPQAERALRQALAVHPPALKTLYRLSSVLDMQQRHEEAWSVLEQAFALSPDSPDTVLAAAKHYAHQERWAETANTAQQAIERKPNSATAHNLLAQALCRLEDFNKALQAARRTVELDTEFAVGHWMLGQILTKLEAFAPAREAIDQALARKPDDNAALMILSAWYRAQGQLPEVTAVTRQCIARQWQELKELPASVLQLDRSKKHMPVTEAGDTLLALHQLLTELEVPYFLAYGTLLGIYRDGDLLPFDKDMDIGLPWSIDRQWLMDKIEASGKWKIKGREYLSAEQAQWNFFVTSLENGIGTDFFFFKPEHDGQDATLLSGFHQRPNPLLWRFSPISIGSIRYRDTDLPAPSDPERFMLDIYGESWRIPDPCFDSVVTGCNLTAESRQIAIGFGLTRLYEQLSRHAWKKAWGYCQQLLRYGEDELLRELGAWCEAQVQAGQVGA